LGNEAKASLQKLEQARRLKAFIADLERRLHDLGTSKAASVSGLFRPCRASDDLLVWSV
jgi:hypothetical protein